MLRRIEKWFVQANQAVVALTMFLMYLLVSVNVITRYMFKFSLNWTDEIARFLMIWTVFLGAGLAMREGRHVAIELLQNYLPKKLRKYFRAFVGIIILTFLSILVVLGYQYAQGTMAILSPVLRWPIGMVYMAIPFGLLVFMLHLMTIFSDYMETSVEKEMVAEILEIAEVSEKKEEKE